jgi:hypothetical protein
LERSACAAGIGVVGAAASVERIAPRFFAASMMARASLISNAIINGLKLCHTQWRWLEKKPFCPAAPFDVLRFVAKKATPSK